MLIAVVACAAFLSGLHAPLIFDDVPSIIENPTIRHLSWAALWPPSGWGLTVSGRPVLNLTLAVNYAISGVDVWSYHALNILIHTLAGLTLFGIIRRTLEESPAPAIEGLRKSVRVQPRVIALVAAMLWTAHPMQAESVTYVIQRAESLMGMFFLVSLYAFVRGVRSGHPGRWRAASIVACLLSAGTKEVAVMIPVIVFLYDRTFVAGSFKEAWRLRKTWHLSLASSWLLLAWSVLATGGNRGGTMGFVSGTSQVGALLTQFEALTRYVWLAFWPSPLVFDYGRLSAEFGVVVVIWAIPVLLLVLLTLVALWRWPVAGFLGAWFFGILAPTTLIPGMLQMIVEHRVYLPLAALVVLGTVSAARWLNVRAFAAVGAALTVVAGVLTIQRNSIYANEEVLWVDTIAKRPLNARAYNNFGRVRSIQGRYAEAVPLHEQSLRLDPTLAQTHQNLGLALAGCGRTAEAVEPFKEAIRILPKYFKAHLSLGNALTKLGRAQEALPYYTQAISLDPEPSEALFRRGVAFAQLRRWREAVADYSECVRLDPANGVAESNWGVALRELGDTAGALPHLEAALRMMPKSADVHFNLAVAYDASGNLPLAERHYAECMRLAPDRIDARVNLGIVAGRQGRDADAVAILAEAVRKWPDSADAQTNYAVALTQVGRAAEAIEAYRAALRLRPQDPRAHFNLGYALLTGNQVAEARTHIEAALRLDPGFRDAAQLLAQLPR